MKDYDYCPKSIALVAAGITALGGFLIGFPFGKFNDYYPKGVKVGDFNNDGYLDVAVFSRDNEETPTNIFFGDETGILTQKDEYEKKVRERILSQIKESKPVSLKLPLELNVKPETQVESLEAK